MSRGCAVPDFDVTKLKGHTAKAFGSLERAIEANGECPPDGFPDGVCTVSRDQWRDQFYADTQRPKNPRYWTAPFASDLLGRSASYWMPKRSSRSAKESG